MTQRRRFKELLPLDDRLKVFSDRLKSEGDKQGPGRAREEIFRRVRRAETASRINEWANSPGLQPPK